MKGDPIVLLNNDGASDEGTIEAPSIVQMAPGTNSHYVLFFSSGCFTGPNYTVNYATAPSITGPYTRATHPLFMSGDYGLVGPGGMSIYRDGKHMVFHARYGSGRALYETVINFK